MRLRLLVLPLALALSSACEPPPARHATEAPTAPAPARVELGDMAIGHGGAAFKIHADGAIEAPDGRRVGVISADGRLVNEQGNLVAALGADGDVDLGPDPEAKAHIADDGTLTITPPKAQPIEAHVADDGTLVTSNPTSEKLTITGATTPAKKRAAMLVLLAVTMRKESGQPKPAPSAAPATSSEVPK